MYQPIGAQRDIRKHIARTKTDLRLLRFPEEYYKVYYKAKGSPEIAREVKKIVSSVSETTDWGLDHGAWPMLMHLFPDSNIPVFQMSIDYYAKPEYHYELGKQLKSLRNKGVLIIGSGSLIHNLQLAMQKCVKMI